MYSIRLRATLFGLTLFASMSAIASPEDNANFKDAVQGLQPVLWKDYLPLQQNSLECSRQNRRETKTCKEVEDQLVRELVDALLQAATKNIGKPQEDKFCDKTTTDLALARNNGGMAAYAMLLIDDRLKFGSGLYKNLPETYLGKIVSDALHAQSPCAP